MVYICIDTGSHAKGYAVESSDTDYHIYTKCDRETFEKFIDNKELLKNRHAKDESGNDVKYVDLYTGLIGILTGKSPELSMFSKREDFKDKYGIENLQLYEFVTKLMTVSMVKIIYTLMRYKILNNAKGLLQLMFNYVYVEYYLDYKRAPKSTKILNMLFNVGDEIKITMDKNNQLVVNDLNVLDLNKNNGGYKIDETLTLFVKNVKLLKLYVKLMQRGEYQQEWTEYFQQWKQQLQDRLHHVPEPPERTDIRHNIVMYALNERGPVMPEDENKIVYQIYPSVSHLDQGKKGTLADKEIIVQEKLDGCNFRIICNQNKITYGSRNTYRPDGNFMNYYRIRKDLETCMRSLQARFNDGFIVYGELMGWKDDAKTTPINVINYVDQKESLKYYAYEIQLYGGEFVPFVEAQELLTNVGFNTIPCHKYLYNDFVERLNFKSLMFPQSPLEGFIIRCGNLIYKLKSDYKDLNKLKIEKGPFEWLTCDYIKSNCDAIDKSDMMKILIFCYNMCEVNNDNEKLLFNKVFNLFRQQFNLNHNDYKNLYKQYVNMCKCTEYK